MEIPFSIDFKGGEIETLMKSIRMNVIMAKCCHQCWCSHQCQREIFLDNCLSWYELLFFIDVN
jgi:hypothetical protein